MNDRTNQHNQAFGFQSFQESKQTFKDYNWTTKLRFREEHINAYNLRLYDNSIYRYFSTIKINGDCPAYIYIHNLSDVSIIEKKIDLNYLNSAAVYNVLYDGEFIWTITKDKNCNLQLLKLKLL